MGETLTFRIIENYEPRVDYEEFKKDFLDVNLRAKDLKKKYGLSKKKWDEYRNKVCEETGLTRKPRNAGSSYGMMHDMKFIRVYPNRYIIAKEIDHYVHYFGSYENLDCAKQVRDILIANDWDIDLGYRLKKKYSQTKTLKPARIKALKMYDEFEELYLHSDMLIRDIQKKLELTSTMYRHLMDELHRIHGKHTRRWFKESYDSEMR